MGIRRQRLLAAAGLAVVLLLLAALAVVLVRAQDKSRRELEERFAIRSTLAARFGESFTSSLVETERERAREQLSVRRVDRHDFRAVVNSLGFEAAVLLDRSGHLIHVWPAAPHLLGERVADRYAHLKAALGGRVAVSNVVPSAARGIPVVAFAVPYETPAGRRVFSGAFAVKDTPLATYLRNAIPIAGSRLYVVDAKGALIFATGPENGATLAARDTALPETLLRSARGSYAASDGHRYFTAARIQGTPWRVIATVPEQMLFEPVGGLSAWLPWVLFAAFACTAAAALLLLVRNARQRDLLGQANAALAARNRELHELDNMKDEFVALVSHELRTPLTSIVGFVRLLLRGRAGEVPPDQREVLQVVERNARRLNALVGDLLFAAKADAGKLTLEASPFPLDELARQAVESAAPFARENDVELTLVVEPSVVVFADRARLAQVLDNLVSNAIKFTPRDGGVAVRFSTADGVVILEVEDSGIGIPESEQERLFERFFRASTATTREIQGSGLGLSVAKTIVELHGGSIAFTSREGKGTVFRVALPIAQAAPAAA